MSSKSRSQARPKVKVAPDRKPSPAATSNKRTLALCLLLAAFAIALYSPVAAHRFLILDDHDYITANPHIQDGLSGRTVSWAFTSTELANWHPLTWLSHALDGQLFGLNPAGHHLHSVLIHAVNVVLLFLILSWVTGKRGASLLVAALFAVHPLNVESVAWAAERKSVLSTFFFLAALAAYVRYAQKPDWRRYSVVAFCFALGLMAKPMVITLPFVLLLMDYWPLARFRESPAYHLRVAQAPVSRLVVEKIPLLLLSAASAVITLKAQRSGLAVRTLQQFSFATRFQTAVVAYTTYLWKMIWPARLAPFYPHSAGPPPAWQLALSAVVLAAITALVIVMRRHRYLLFGWLWFLGTLVPVIGLVQVGDAAMADRYTYIPLIGIFIMIAFGCADLAERIKVGRVWQLAPALGVLAALAIVTQHQLTFWRTEYSLWSHTLAVTGRNPFAHEGLATALLEPEVAMDSTDLQNLDTPAERMDAARRHYEDALQIRTELAQRRPTTYLPDMATTLNNLGNLDRAQENNDAARRHYEAALAIHRRLVQMNVEPYLPDMALCLNNLGFLDKAENQLDEANQYFAQALAIYRRLADQNPDMYLSDLAGTLNNLAITELGQQRMQEARLHYEESLRIRRRLAQQSPQTYVPDVAFTLNDLGNLDAEQGRADDAQAHYGEAVGLYRDLARRNPEIYLSYLAGTLNNLGFLEMKRNHLNQSRGYYQEALTIYRELANSDPSRFANDISRVEASLLAMQNAAPVSTESSQR